MFNNSAPSLADIAAVTGNNRNNDGMWGDWFWVILVFALFGWGGNGFGGWGGNGSQAGFTDAAVQRGFDQQAVVSKLDGINNGICSLGYDQLAQMNGINTNIMQTGFGLQGAVNDVSRQLADCCCENREAIAQVRYDMATNTCAITNQMAQGFSQLDRTISDKFCELEMNNMRRELAQKDATIAAMSGQISNDAQTRELVNTLRPCPIPAYQTCNPWATNGTGYNSCCNGYN